MVLGMPEIKAQNEVCKGCLMSKQVMRSSFPRQTTYNAKKALEIIHRDLCGPIAPATTAGNTYLFILVDDFTRVMWVNFLKSKNETLEAFKNFRANREWNEKLKYSGPIGEVSSLLNYSMLMVMRQEFLDNSQLPTC